MQKCTGFPPWDIVSNETLVFDIELKAIGEDIQLLDKYELMKRKVATKFFKGRKLTNIEYLLPGQLFFIYYYYYFIF